LGAVSFCGYFGSAHFYDIDIGRAAPDKANG
jgi:multidrug efflux system membrane fusion protein